MKKGILQDLAKSRAINRYVRDKKGGKSDDLYLYWQSGYIKWIYFIQIFV